MDLLIFKRFDELLAVEKSFLSSIQPLDHVINIPDVKKPAVGIIQFKSQVFMLVDPRHIIGKRKRKDDMPKYAIFIADENYEFAILADEILSFCALKGKNKSLLKKSQEKIFQIENLDDYGSVKVIDVKNLELHNSLEAPKEKKFTVGEFEVEKAKKTAIEKYFTFSISGKFFAFNLTKVRRVYHMDAVRLLDTNSFKGFFLADFNDLICPLISTEKRKNIFQVFVPSDDKGNNQVLAFATEDDCYISEVDADSIKKISLKSSRHNNWDFSKLGSIFEEHSLYSFNDNNNNQVNVVELNLLKKFTESLPFSPFISLKRESGQKNLVINIVINEGDLNFIFPLSQLLKVDLIKLMKVNKNSKKNLMYTEFNRKIYSIFEFNTVLGLNNSKDCQQVLFFDYNNFQFGLMVSSMSDMQIDSALLESDEYFDARFKGVAARKLRVSGKSMYLLNQDNLKQRLLDMSQ